MKTKITTTKYTFTDYEITDIYLKNNSNPLTEQLVIDELDFTIITKKQLDIDINEKVKVYSNNKLLGVFFVTKRERLKNDKLRVTCENIIGLLDKSHYPAKMFKNRSFESIIEEIFDDEPTGVNIAGSLKSKLISGYFPGGSKRELLQYLCFVVGASTNTQYTENLNITVYGSKSQSVQNESIYYDWEVNELDVIRSIAINYFAYVETTDPVGQGVIEVSGTNYNETRNSIRINNPVTYTGRPSTDIVIDNIQLINSANVNDIINQLAAVYFSTRRRFVGRIDYNGEHAGRKTSIETFDDELLTGWMSNMSFVLGSRTTCDVEIESVTAVNVYTDTSKVVVRYVGDEGGELKRETFTFPIGVDFEISTNTAETYNSTTNIRVIYIPEMSSVTGTSPATAGATLTIAVPCVVALVQAGPILIVYRVDSAEYEVAGGHGSGGLIEID